MNAVSLREQFPILRSGLAYLDSASSTQKPLRVIEREASFYKEQYANVHRGVYKLSQTATDAYEGVRRQTAAFINAKSEREIVFTKGTTEAINLVASTFGRQRVGAGDEVLITEMEHHSNIVPWQMLCEEKGAKLVVAAIDDDGVLLLDKFASLITAKTKLIAVSYASNVLGTINPIREIVQMANGIPVLVDAAQAVAHERVDVQALGCDFFAFSSHKMYGPTGVGVLHGKLEHLESMPPYQGGGDMIRTVSFEKTQYNEVPFKFEAGTPNIAGVVGFGEAISFTQEALRSSGENALTQLTIDKLKAIPGLQIIGNAEHRSPVVSFVMDGVHPHDIGTILDINGVAIRAGHHCAEPLMHRLNVPATARVSLGVYNDESDIDKLLKALHKVREVFG
jgi:cysteine desulfurase/selenocysteine lyase